MADEVGAVSPHLDDLALSCASFLAAHPGSHMVTTFAGGPEAVDPLPAWDADSGAFLPGADVVGERRHEDLLASATLGASSHHLGHWDWQYRDPTYGYDGPTKRSELANGISGELASLVDALELDTWVIPLGLVHPDHQATASGCLNVASSHPEIDWLVYEDLPYAQVFPSEMERATARLLEQGFTLSPALGLEFEFPIGDPIKQRAIECYRSQLGPLGEGVDLAVTTPERIHRLLRVHN
ncbi:MAG: PIG-L family deacetylase [Acidimicrobiales bacterium]|nr:PIG-L family deacetylase [Acidimicrobiales bacterium]